ncbi:hypothetical protein L7F22_048297 [Adiantum nelumboides]|nr:hypothetical protein [Adiantum nelumboides]
MEGHGKKLCNDPTIRQRKRHLLNGFDERKEGANSLDQSSACAFFFFLRVAVICVDAMGSECVVFEGASFPTTIASTSNSKTLVLLGNGIYDTEIHYLQIKFYSIGAYAEADIGHHLKEWKGKSEDELIADDSGFFLSFCKATVEKLAKLVIIKEVKGSQFITPLQSSVRDRLAYADLYEDEEEEALESLVELFQKKAWLAQGSSIFLHWPSPSLLQACSSLLHVCVCALVCNLSIFGYAFAKDGARTSGQQLRVPEHVLLDEGLAEAVERIWEAALASEEDVASQCAAGISELSRSHNTRSQRRASTHTRTPTATNEDDEDFQDSDPASEEDDDEVLEDVVVEEVLADEEDILDDDEEA